MIVYDDPHSEEEPDRDRVLEMYRKCVAEAGVSLPAVPLSQSPLEWMPIDLPPHASCGGLGCKECEPATLYE